MENAIYTKFLTPSSFDINLHPNIFEYNDFNIIHSYENINWYQDIVSQSTVYFSKLTSLYNGSNRFFIAYNNNRQVYFQTALQTGIENGSEIIPDKPYIKSIYPNPFNNETKITIDLKDDSNVKLELYNTQGQLIQTVLDKKMNKGRFEYNIMLSNVNSGTYYCKLSVNGILMDTKKLLYLK
ncbi:MAG TPA: T9SS type A sorting domain-containing protein [Clostridiales bacterium]|nr:T9SS type A sorting domain-containing protein [Clostridiales bacterium]HQP70967.1 T9SS type A sorting domain-containing protein [Clostridiales bacterium]